MLVSNRASVRKTASPSTRVQSGTTRTARQQDAWNIPFGYLEHHVLGGTERQDSVGISAEMAVLS